VEGVLEPGKCRDGESLVHRFEVNGSRLILDVNSGALFEVDQVAWDIVGLGARAGFDEVMVRLGKSHQSEHLEAAFRELCQLKDRGLLFSRDRTQQGWYDGRELPCKALCLHVSHDCNLRCAYCFAQTGNYGGQRRLMPLEVARAAVDFLLRSCGPQENLEVDFFGGEPLLNLAVIKQVVEYAREQEEKHHKRFHFTVTTNAVSLDEDTIRFLNCEVSNVVLSLDGRPEVHDSVRRLSNGRGSYQLVRDNILRFVASRDGDYWVRGTFTRCNLDFSRDVLHLADLGFRNISVEPVVGLPDDPYSIRPQDLPRVEKEYETLARAYLERWAAGRGFYFFHFEVDLEGGPCLAKRLTGCGAGSQYLAVAPDGGLYPCHQFVGREGFAVGNVFSGLVGTEIVDKFRKANIYRKEDCRLCWARFYCGGGCHANAHLLKGSIYRMDPVGCALQKKRIECALWLKARRLQGKVPVATAYQATR